MEMDPSSTTSFSPQESLIAIQGLPTLNGHGSHGRGHDNPHAHSHLPPHPHEGHGVAAAPLHHHPQQHLALHHHAQHQPHPHHHPHTLPPPPPPPPPPLPPPAPSAQHYALAGLPGNAPDLDISVLDGSNPSIFLPNAHAHPHLQPMQPAAAVPVLHSNPHDPAPPQPHSLDTSPVTAPPPPPLPPPHPPPPSHSAPPSHGSHESQGPFGLLTPGPIAHLPQDDGYLPPPHAPSAVNNQPPDSLENRPHGQLITRIVIDPPDLDHWRQKLFLVDEMIVLTNDEFETYFPHIDNVYSHRSTQKYKRKPFISHYWDCRMKGRPPGTPKSDDPSKKKRKRSARERDLCDVKIKITEYFPGAVIEMDDGSTSVQQPGVPGEKFWTIQRVNGNGGNGKQDGVAGPHKHSLEKSDEIKKSTVQRFLNAQEKEAKKSQKPLPKKVSGPAQMTAKKHAKEHELKLYAACFCPFSQRVWIALEVKGMSYQYCETDPFKRPTQLLEANPRGTVPAIREGDWASGESAIILEYLEDHDQRVPLFPTDPRLKANCRLWIDHINAKVVPSYFALLRATDHSKQGEYIDRLQNDITALVQAADERGPYFLGADLCLVDVHFAPFVLRLSRILSELRHWSDPMPGTRWHVWVEALEQNPHIQATTSQPDLYLETYDVFLHGRSPNGGEA